MKEHEEKLFSFPFLASKSIVKGIEIFKDYEYGFFSKENASFYI